jgi:peptidoglycan hydrolase-like protein with peptidoglycan-binding domain
MIKRMFSRRVSRPALLLFLAAGLGVSAAHSKAQSSAPAKKKTGPSTAASHSGKTSLKSGSKTGSKKGRKSSRRQPGQKAPTTDRISEIQTALAKDGSFKGTPNGKWDDSTVEAVKKFQTAHGMNPTGRLDAPTLQKLGLGSSTTGVAPPQTPPGAVSKLSTSKFNSADPSSDNQR